MSLSRFLSITSLAVAAGSSAGSSGCGDDSCGPGGAPDTGLVASGDALTLTYGHLRGSPANDCNDPAAPGVISVTITGMQTDGTGLIALCVRRPDLLAGQAQALGAAPGSPVVLDTVSGGANGCTFALDRAQAVTGTATSSGLCGNGGDPAGFALVLDGSATLNRTCGAAVDAVTVALRGRVAVAGP